MNIYSIDFHAKCPTNGIRICYRLRIEVKFVIQVEVIVDVINTITDGFHEAIADLLFAKFGGRQTLTADHHSVNIQTIREP